MHKAIQLKAILWIEGDDAPPHDFAQSTMQAVQEMLAAGCNTHPELQVTLKALTEETDLDTGAGNTQPVIQPTAPSAKKDAWSQLLAWLRSAWARLWPHESSSGQWQEDDKEEDKMTR